MLNLMTPMLLLFGLGQAFRDMISAILQPIYWAVSGLIVLAHKIWSPVFGQDSGLTWVLSIITLTVVIRTLLIPLFVQQINSARNMQLVAPKARALQEKYGHDRERLGQETMKLYREEGVNPMASCLPLLLQMPIFLALFRVLQGVAVNPKPMVRGHFFKTNPELVESLRNAEFMGARLSGTFMQDDGFGPTRLMAIVLIIGMTAVLFIQQLQLMRKNMPPEALTGPMAQQQKMMLYLFPVIYLFSGLAIPIGVLVYWMTTNLWTMVQQYILIHNNPTPNTPAYVDWQERMRAKGKDPDQIEADRRAKRLRRAGGANPGATAVPLVEDEQGNPVKPTVQRQGVTRQTVRKTTDGKQQVIRRQQPARQTRQTRKKK